MNKQQVYTGVSDRWVGLLTVGQHKQLVAYEEAYHRKLLTTARINILNGFEASYPTLNPMQQQMLKHYEGATCLLLMKDDY